MIRHYAGVMGYNRLNSVSLANEVNSLRLRFDVQFALRFFLFATLFLSRVTVWGQTPAPAAPVLLPTATPTLPDNSASPNISNPEGPAPATNSAPTVNAGSSDSGDFHARLLFRVQRALEERLGADAVPSLGKAGGLHWIFLIQVARYPDSNVRMTGLRRGVQLFLDDLINARKAWAPGEVNDTVSLLPYHFNLLGEPRERLTKLSEYLTNPAPLKERVPGQPQADTYQKFPWQDGHDWRASMQQMLEWAGKNDVDLRHAVVIVLDWNDLAQAPMTRADGTKAPANNRDLVLPENKARYDAHLAALSAAGFDGAKGLETVQVGNLEYDMAVFTRPDLAPLPSGSPPPSDCPPGTVRNTDGACVPPPPPPPILPLIILVGISAAVAALFLRPHRIRLNDESIESLRLLGRDRLDIIVEGGETKAPARFVLSQREVPNAPEGALATIKLAFPGKIVVSGGAFVVKPSSGFKEAPGGLLLTSRNGEFELFTNDRRITVISLRRL